MSGVEYHHYRDLESVRTWLGSEGYLVDDYLDQFTINGLFDTVLSGLKALPTTDNVSVAVTGGHYDKRLMYLDATIGQGDHQATRRFKLELLPAY